MTDVAFTYPGAPKPQLTGVTVRLSMSSRVALLVRMELEEYMIKLLTE